jgi:pimeloyl-ACP methyl ester carboxylesterase
MRQLVLVFSLLIFFQVAPAWAQPACPQKATTSPADFGYFTQISVNRQITQNPNPDAPLPVSVFIPATATTSNRVPVIFFSHGFNALDYHFYEQLLRQLASNGFAVVYVPYTSSGTNASRYNQLWSGFQKAVQQFGNFLDTTRVGFAGHSYGGGATPEMARLGAAQGWGTNGLFIFTMAPWYSWGTNYEQIPAYAKLVVQVYWDDDLIEHLISQNDVWNRLPQVTERKWEVIRSAQTLCLLTNSHIVPATGSVDSPEGKTDALDKWGVWRRIHALAAYTFTGNLTAKEVVFGSDQRMGRWRVAPRVVTPMQVSASPVLNTNINTLWSWPMRCSVADPGTPCP